MILLLHSGNDRRDLERARRLHRGAELAYPDLDFDRVVGRTPDDDPTTGARPSTARLVEYAVRRISGWGGLIDQPVDAVWVASAITRDVAPQVAAAERAGVPVRVLEGWEVEQLLQQGELALSPLQPAEAPQERADFTSPESVVLAYFCAAEAALGLQALPLARLSRCGGNAHGRKDRLELCGLRVSFAAAIMRRAQASPRWRPEMLQILWVAYVGRGSMATAAQLCGLGQSDVARRRASRMRSRALGLIREQLEKPIDGVTGK